MRKAASALAFVATVVLTGCSANHHSIYRHQPVAPPSVTLVDAKQRAILSAIPTTGSGAARFCAEPSPDVFAVIAQAVSADGSFGRSGDPKVVEAALKAAFGSSEQGSTIPRTQTNSLLREMMYRTCERHLNGAIGSLELSAQAARDQRLLVSILAIEQLTGAITPKPVVIGASASGSSSASGADAAIRLDDQHKVVQAAAAAVKQKQAAYDQLENGTDKDCTAIAKAVTEKKEDSLAQSLKDKRPKCEAAASELAAAKKDKADAEAHYAKLASATSSGGVSVTVGGAVMPQGTDNNSPSSHQAAAISKVANTVRHIVSSTFAQDEFMFVCLKVLDGNTAAEQLAANCLAYMRSKIDLQRKSNDVTAEEIATARTEIQQRSTALFDQFWLRVKTPDDKLDAEKLASVKQSVNPEDWPACFAGAETREALKTCFLGKELTASQMRRLAQGGKSS